MKSTKIKIYIVIFILAVIAVLYFHYGSPPNNLSRCPDDYPDTDAGLNEKMADMDKWTNNYYDKHPSASLSDWSKARLEYWKDNKCEKAIKRYNEAKSGKADPETMNFIKNTIINN